MKKFLLFLMFALFCIPWAANAQETLTVHDGTATNGFVPVYGFYADAYLKCEMVYPAAELEDMDGATITSMTFYATSPASGSWGNANFQVFLTEVTDATISAFVGPGTVVYEGALDGTQSEITITFNTPYVYNGGNLLVGVYNTVKGTYKSITWAGEEVTGASIQGYSYNSLDEVTAGQRNFLPKTTFAYVPEGGDYCPKPRNVAANNITAHTAVMTWDYLEEAEDGYKYLYWKASEEEPSIVETTSDNTVTLTGLDPETTYNFEIYTACADMDFESTPVTVSFTTPIACPAPTGLAYSDITANSAVLNWTGTSNSYNVSYRTAAYAEGVYEQFNNSGFPSGWTRYSGLVDGVLDGTATLATTTAGWNTNTYALGSYNMKVNIYGTSCKYWLVTPEFTLDQNLSFDLALTDYGNSDPIEDNTAQADDRFVVLIYANNAWTILREWNNSGSDYVYNNISSTGENVTIDLSAYNGQNVKIAFYGESTASGGDNDLHIDNVFCGTPIPAGEWQTVTANASPATITGLAPETKYEVKVQGNCGEDGLSAETNIVTFTTPAECPIPTGLTYANVTAHEATISWTSLGAAAWQIQLGEATPIDVTEPTYTFTGLVPETPYSVKVRTNCDGVYTDWTNAVTFTTGIACFAPTGLAATLTPGDGSVATLNWTSEASAWVVAYKTAADEEFTEVNVTENPFTLTGLTAETAYTAKVKAVCGGEDGESQWSSTITFTPTDAFTLTVNDGTSTNGCVPIYGYWCDNITKSQFIIPAGDLAPMQWGTINKLTFYASNESADWGDATFEVYMTETSETTLSALADYTTMEKVMNAGTLSISGNKMVVELNAPYQYLGGNLMIGFLQTVSGSWKSCSWYGVSAASGASYGGYGTSVNAQSFLPKTTFFYEPGEEPACQKPTGVTVNYEGGTEATVSWTSDATAWNMRVNGTEINGTITNPYTLTGLDVATIYEVEVQANCGDATSDWTSPVSFTTDLCLAENECAINIALTDSYGDGWNGGQLSVVDALTEEVLGTYTISTGNSANYTLNVCDGRDINIVYTAGSYPTENGWVVTAVTNEIISEHEGCSSGCAPTAGIQATYTVGCSTDCAKPFSLVAEPTENTATLNWEGYQESYNLKYRKSLADPTEPATIILEANDVWGDGSGYQMLLDADANTYGTLWNANHYIFVDGTQYSGGDLPAEYYDEFEYKVPTSADGSLATTNVVVTGSVTITIPAGTYDYVILNPTPGDRFYVAADNGEVGGAEDDFVFEPGVTYHFTMQQFGSNDGAAFEVTRPMGDWVVVENVTSPYELAELDPATYYEWQVEGINANCTEDLTSATAYFTTDALCGIVLNAMNNYKWRETFESYDVEHTDGGFTHYLPKCWTLVKEYTGASPDLNNIGLGVDTLPQVFYYPSFDASTGNQTLRMKFHSLVAMPELDESVDMSRLHLSMWVRQPQTYYHLQVGVLTDLTDDSTFEPLVDIDNESTDMEQFELDFSSYQGEGRYIAFKNVGGSSRNPYCTQYLDDIVLTYNAAPAECGISELYYEENFEGYTINPGATGVEPDCWEVIDEISALDFSTKPQLYAGFNTTEGGNYTLRMLNRCVYAMPELSSTYDINNLAMTFKLRQPKAVYCLQVGVLDADNNFVLVEEINNESADMEDVMVNFNDYTGNGHRIAFRNVLNGRHYKYSYNYLDDIRIDLSENFDIDPAKSINDLTDGADEYLNRIAVYPNPTTGMLHIDAVDVQKVECYNQMGKLVGVYDNANELNISEFATGVYMLRITVPQGVTMRKVVKK